MQTKLGLRILLPNDTDINQVYASTDRDTCIDWCMTNNASDNEQSLQVYECWFSDHKPLWLEINK